MAEATAARGEAGNSRGLPAVLESGMRGFRGLPSGRQFGALALGAAGLTLMVALLVWAMRPTFAPLTGPLPAGEASEVLRVLAQAGVPYRVDGATQSIEVPASRVAEARLLVAEQGLPSRGDFGFELLQQESGFGTSRLVEGARFHRAIEGELARTIASLSVVESARVHIAQAERSVFIRERRPATASVVVHLARGERLADRQVDAIVHLVASSVPELEPEQVTVVDQQGRLLTMDDPMMVGGGEDQLQYQRRVEAAYVERVLALLEPIYGAGRVRVQVAADVDFSRVERTEERFDPDSAIARSEQLRDEERVGVDGLMGGVPGALTNQPPAGGAVANEAPAENGAAAQRPGSRVTESTRNFEIDRSIAHVREMPGAVRRVSTAVVVDFAETAGANGEVVREARDAAELDQLRALVQEAVGFSAARGDTIQVVSAPFSLEDATMVTAAQAFWREPWFVELIKVVIAALVALVVLLTVVRPAVRQLLASPEREDDERETGETAGRGAATPALTMEPSAVAALTGPKGPDQQQLDLDAVREMVREDPKRVAQVIKEWVGDGDGK